MKLLHPSIAFWLLLLHAATLASSISKLKKCIEKNVDLLIIIYKSLYKSLNKSYSYIKTFIIIIIIRGHP